MLARGRSHLRQWLVGAIQPRQAQPVVAAGCGGALALRAVWRQRSDLGLQLDQGCLRHRHAPSRYAAMRNPMPNHSLQFRAGRGERPIGLAAESRYFKTIVCWLRRSKPAAVLRDLYSLLMRQIPATERPA